jgi:hypothetical protein
MLNRDCVPTASLTAALSLGSTLKASAIQELATSTFSASSAVRVPSFREVERKSIMDSARRFFESERDCIAREVGSCFFRHLAAEFEAYHAFWMTVES